MKIFEKILSSVAISFLLLCLMVPSFSVSQDSIIPDPALFYEPVNGYEKINKEDFEQKKIEALQGEDLESFYRIGMAYVSGEIVERDYVQAREWILRAAYKDHPAAMLQAARLFSLGKTVAGFYASSSKAKKWIEKAMELGSAEAFFQAALWRESGIVYNQSFEKALNLFKIADEMGYFNSKSKLYIAYMYGIGTEPNLGRAIKYLREIEGGASFQEVKMRAKNLLGEIYFKLALQQTDENLKFKLYELAYLHGKKLAIDAIADSYSEGTGVEKDYFTAIAWYEKAIEEYESIYAFEKLGQLYMTGPGDMNKDYKKAMDYFKKGSRLGGVNASYFLGHMHYYGLGVKKDYNQSRKWFDRAKKMAEISKKKARQPLSDVDIDAIIQSNLR